MGGSFVIHLIGTAIKRNGGRWSGGGSERRENETQTTSIALLGLPFANEEGDDKHQTMSVTCGIAGTDNIEAFTHFGEHDTCLGLASTGSMRTSGGALSLSRLF